MTGKVDQGIPAPGEGLPELAELWATHVWTHRTAGILRGLTHAFGNRLHALEMLRSGIEPGETLTTELLGFLQAELVACEVLTESYGAIGFAGQEERMACRIVEVLPESVRLRAAHVDVAESECAVAIVGDPPAILAPPRALMQALLLLLLEDVPGCGATPAVDVRGAADGVAIAIRGGAAHDSAETALVAVRWLLRDVVPAVTCVRDGAAVVLTLPSLAASRRSERSTG